MAGGEQSSFSEPLLSGLRKATPYAKSNSATEALAAKVARIKRAVQDRRDSPSTLLGCAVFFGVLSGVVAYVYSAYFETMLWLMWEVCGRSTAGFAMASPCSCVKQLLSQLVARQARDLASRETAKIFRVSR